MKIFGITAGRKNGNSEILLKEAFMAAEAQGAEVEMVNLHDHKILPCTGCEACTMRVMKGLTPQCIHHGKDDMDLIMDRFLKADGIIVCIPTFIIQPQGIYKVFVDRWLPYEIMFLLENKLIDKEPERVAGLIAVGGSTQSWMSLALPALTMSMFVQSIKVVDQMLATQVARPGHVLLKPELLSRASQLGRNVAAAMKTPYDQVKYLGEEEGWCPVCHSNLLMQGKPQWNGLTYDIECAVCSAGGSLVTEAGRTKFVLAENGLDHCRAFSDKRANHLQEIKEVHGEAFRAKDEIKEKSAKYREYKVATLKQEGGK
jgi:multimeric flavodoxin WrbA